ncbi:hypothetical protein Tco_0740768, partial [Tanacetum coccineum]
MTTLKFADTHNMVAFLAKPAESEGFEQIVDFLNAHTIKYALTVNPTIYTSCIEQFWATVKAKTVNGEVQLQALVDGKKIIITESIVRRDLQLEDAEGVDCLPNATIFEQLTLMGYEKISQKLTFYKAFFSPQWKFLIHTILQCLSSKTTAWNEFSSTMASAIICLATNQKFNFSKYIFESMVKNLDNAGKFLMYPRFVQVFVNKQLEGMPAQKRIYIATSHTKKIFDNMRRSGKDFSSRVTPLFQTMVVQDQGEMGKGSANPTDPHQTLTIIQPLTSQPQKKQRSRRLKRKDTKVPQPSDPTNIVDEVVNEEMDDSLVRAATTASSLEVEQDSDKRKDTQVPLLSDPTNVTDEAVNEEPNMQLKELMEITSLKLRVKKLEKKGGSRTHKLKRLYKVGRSAIVISSDEASLGDQEDASKQKRKIDDIDKDVKITLVDETQGSIAGVAITVSAAATTVPITPEEITLAQALEELKTAKPKVKGIVFKEPVESTITTTISSKQPLQANVQDKGKGKMVKPEKPTKRKNQIRHDEEVTQRHQAQLQAELEEEDRL